MQDSIKPKRTVYNGIRFKSRLEARWAIFFDNLGIEYQYEPEYDEVQAGLAVVWYKPDFFIPSLNCSIEIKPREPSELSLTKAAGWVDFHPDIYIFYELRPPSKESESGWLMYWSNKHKKATLSKGHWWTECLVCRRIAITEGGEHPRECLDKCYTGEALDTIFDWYSMSDREMDDDVYPYSSLSPRLLKAYTAARKATFK
ncbi:MAG: hypothetical protein HZB21_06645 [Deltaproteobacteria bacterium]|nr:hypothetical protein [Deltaproteobacteria bacterium]MBI5810846.1 hypothetical protein [Deltaproteobacteria bacterium]